MQELILGIIDNYPHVELLVSLNAGMPLEALAARDHLQQWIKPANISMWHGVAEGGEAIDGYTEKRRLSEVALAYHVASLNPDVALSASPFEGSYDKAVPLMPNGISKIPLASIFYDAIPYRYPEQYLSSPALRAYYERRLASYSEFDLNLCISEYSRRECVEISRNPRAFNMLAGVSRDFRNAMEHAETRVPRPTEKPFILYVGGLDWRKNVRSAIEAFAQLPADLQEQYSFVLAGDHPQSLLRDEQERWKKLGLPEQSFVAIGHVTDSQLVALYKETDLAIQPSLLEGFGLTALEAMTCGTPVIASNTGALPEVIGDREFLFNPADVKDIARVMKRALGDRQATKATAERQRNRAAAFSWAKSAAIAVAALKDAMVRAAESGKIEAVSAIQYAALQRLGNMDLPADFIAQTFARSELAKSSGPRLIVDATSTYRVDHKTGIQRVVKNICANLEMLQGDDVERIVAYSDSLDGWFAIPKTLEKPSTAISFTEDIRLEFSPNDRILMLDSSWEFYRHHYKTLRAARLRGAIVISCLYDTIPLRFPGFCDPGMPPTFSNWFQAALSYSNAFICISKAVADELIAIFEAIQFPREMKIGFWHLGADFAKAAISVDIPPVRRNGRWNFLMVGTLEPRKGHGVALEAFDRLWDEGIDIGLTIVGKPGWEGEHFVRRIEQHREYGKRLIWLNGISDEKLQKAYGDSDALIAASYAEGFGLPIVEAAHFGKAVIASDIPVFREVTASGQNCYFFTVGSPTSLVETIRSFLETGKNGIETLPLIGRVNGGISWKESAEELQRVVLTDDWYRMYRPQSNKTYVPISDIGITKMGEVLTSDETRHKIELVEGPIVGDNGMLKYMVRVANLSPQLWSSVGNPDGSLAVMASYRILSNKGETIFPENHRSRIPFVLPPGNSLYMSIEIPSAFKRKGGAFTDIGLLQESVGWWSNPLRVPL
ncbi:glycosyltransferase family 4 protein [Rhizobium lusitanum]|uniref:glycosyltransferase family 4 protein n=1 Tax=Rhizobium lusitanum TaxID=293958 RepID=UPI00161C0D29|nr:glycosyltransferase family 1 protein [Rhizobium lusitanum]QND48895.1 glycosyltransferase family 4 protein [Rhizobium lusitanum]